MAKNISTILIVFAVGWILYLSTPEHDPFKGILLLFAAFNTLILLIVMGVNGKTSKAKVWRTNESMKEGVKAEGTAAVHVKPSSGLRGSFPLNVQTINEKVNSGSAGVYSLGYLREKTFLIQHIGRSDTNVNAQLKEYVGKYDRFKFEYADSSEPAFRKECELYHAFGGKIPHNKNHPERPQGSTWLCPKCKVFDSQVSPTTTEKRFCIECGVELPPDVQFCTSCGKEASQVIE